MDLDWVGLLVCLTAGFLLFVSRSWRLNLASLGLLYLGEFLLLLGHWPLEQAAIKLVGGWMAVAVLGATWQRTDTAQQGDDAGLLFRMVLFALFSLAGASYAGQAAVWFRQIGDQAALAGILLALAGMVRSGMVHDPLQVILSLLVALAGFETLFSYLDSSALMTALLAVVNLSIAVTGAYLAAFGQVDSAESAGETLS